MNILVRLRDILKLSCAAIMCDKIDFKELMSRTVNLAPDEALKELEDKWDFYLRNMAPELINWLYTRAVYLCQVTGEVDKEKMYIVQYMGRNSEVYKTCRYFNERLKVLSKFKQ